MNGAHIHANVKKRVPVISLSDRIKNTNFEMQDTNL